MRMELRTILAELIDKDTFGMNILNLHPCYNRLIHEQLWIWRLGGW